MTACTACIGEASSGAPGPSKGGPEPQPLPYEVEVTSASSGLRSALQAGEFHFALDAGRALGGEQSAASPVQGFIGSIVACTQITLQIVAKDAGVELPAISWRGFGVFDAQRLVSGSETDPRFQRITVHGKVEGAAVGQAELDALAARTSARCPISQSLHPSIVYELKLEKQRSE
ncbi:hypothetical protein ABPG75_005892 [Micractinium tetrahymenae]